MKELRTVCCQILALCHLRGPGPTKMEGHTLASISVGRFACCLALCVVRIAVAVSLLITGLLWLATTPSTTDLILNAAALSFVMDMDELIFETMVPATVQRFVESVEPVRYRKPPLNLEALLPLATSAALVLVCYLALVSRNIQAMRTVRDELCGGNRNFVLHQNALGYVVAKESKPYNGTVGTEGLMQLAVSELRDFDFDDKEQRSAVIQNEDQFNQEVDTTYEDSADILCIDFDTFGNGSMMSDLAHWFTAAREGTGLNSGKSLSEVVWKCEDHTAFCQTHGWVRRLCPLTCGCHDPHSGLLFTSPAKGCATPCGSMLTASLGDVPCSDMDPNNAAWTEYWTAYLGFILRNVPSRVPTYQPFIDRELAGGCADTELDPVVGHDFCDEDASFLKVNGMRGILTFCPVTCCNRTNRHAWCDAMQACPASWR
mmetsp:Transcript_19192/g.52719  ORF Transcript_19192/g.52719 Transcript_19192/m.52719 type:complete len:431 (-) Transcript_19192:75-1367(-)